MHDRWTLCAKLPRLPPLCSLRAPSHALYHSAPLGKKIRNTFLPCMNRPVIPPILPATPTPNHFLHSPTSRSLAPI
ncbi:hypothetical protein BT69DRAFT_1282981 [Atractiella rhizophila]|nr:hypothetical protein BT69DRAFT_1282981 [Atractiella rhizophila]